MALTFSISEKERLVVISLRGILDEGSAASLDECAKAAVVLAPLGVVLNFSLTAELTKVGLRAYAPFLRSLKMLCGVIRIAGLDPKDQRLLVEQGMAGSLDIKASLEEAIRDAAQQIRGKHG